MQLFELAQQYQAVQSMMDDPEMDVQAVIDTLEGIAGEFEDMADNVACMIKSMDAEARALKAEADILAQRAKAKSARADRMKDYLYQQMAAVGKRKLETSRNLLQIKKAPPSVRFLDERQFMEWAANHPEYLRQKPPEADKTAIKDAIRAGVEVPGVSLAGGETFHIK